jgi:magnesium transporter
MIRAHKKSRHLVTDAKTEEPIPPRITIIDFDEINFEEKEIGDVQDLAPYRETATVSWINVRGLSDLAMLNRIGDLFKLHPLTIEDILNTSQRPKMEDMVDYVFLSMKVFRHREGDGQVTTRQVAIVIGKNYLLSFEEEDDPLFEPVKEKLRKYKGRIRRMGTDYLAYRLLGAVVDGYFVVLEKHAEKLELLEEMVVTNPNPTVLRAIHALRIEMTWIYRLVWPLREVVGALTREELPVIRKNVDTYFRDIYNHTIQIIETMETDRDMISGMLDIYVSSMSNKMNEIMKVLTVIGTIFIPMTFFAGVWGMNFEHMPEIGWQWSYLLFWLLMVAIAIFMLLYFRRKKWL